MTKCILYWILVNRRKGKKVKESSKANLNKDFFNADLGVVSKPYGGSDFVGDDVVVGVARLVQNEKIIGLTMPNVQVEEEKGK